MRLLRPFLLHLSALRKPQLGLGALLLALIALNADPVLAASDIEAYARNSVAATNSLANIFYYISYIMGAVLVALGISELRRVVDGSGGGSMTWRHPFTKFFFGGMFLALPSIVAMVAETMRAPGTFSFTMFKAFTFGPAGNTTINSGGVGSIIQSSINSIGFTTTLVSVIAFFVGVFFVMRGLQMLRAHIDNPGGSPLPDALKRLAVGGASLSMPLMYHVVKNSFGIQGMKSHLYQNKGWASGTFTSTGGLDGMVVNFIQDIANPIYFGIEVFCYVAGAVMILFAMQRLVRTAQDGPRGPLGFGTIVMFFVSGLLLSFPQLLTALDISILSKGVALTNVDAKFMSLAGANTAQVQAATRVISAILAFMAVIGFLSILRGLFLLKTLGDGGQATIMQVTVHFVAGALAVNLGAFINAVQHSLGLSPGSFAVVFS